MGVGSVVPIREEAWRLLSEAVVRSACCCGRRRAVGTGWLGHGTTDYQEKNFGPLGPCLGNLQLWGLFHPSSLCRTGLGRQPAGVCSKLDCEDKNWVGPSGEVMHLSVVFISCVCLRIFLYSENGLCLAFAHFVPTVWLVLYEVISRSTLYI